MSAPPPEHLLELHLAARRALTDSTAAKVVGERVKVREIVLTEGMLPGLVAEVVRRGVAHRVSLADLQVDGDSGLSRIVERYRALCGWVEPVEADVSERPRGGEITELVVNAVKASAATCRPVGAKARVTLRAASLHRLIPGEIARVRVRKSWRYAGHDYVSGEVQGTTLEVSRLGLVPLRLVPQDVWGPEEEEWGDEPLPAWAQAIVARGPRPAFEMEQVLPGADPEDWDSDPITDAVELREAGQPVEARALLMKELEGDLRCLDAHAHLGNWTFDVMPDLALRHHEAAVRIGELSLGPGFEGVLPWGLVDNRPFLRCLHGYGLALWRARRAAEAAAVFQRLLWLNPADNQGIRFLVTELAEGRTWEEAESGGL